MEFSTWAFGYLRSHKDSDICKALSGDLTSTLAVLELMEAAWNASATNHAPNVEKCFDELNEILDESKSRKVR